MKRIFTSIAFLIAMASVAATADADPADPIGISKAKPADGRYVEHQGKYLVPYKKKIPGTDVDFEMVPIPGGKIKIGSPEGEEGRKADEGPQFEIAVEPYWMGKYEVRWAEYKRFMDLYDAFKGFEIHRMRPVDEKNKVDAITAPTKLYEPDHTFEYGERPQQAAVTMTPYAARQYTKWLSLLTGHFYRLPTEAEWEYACRAGTNTAYHFGDQVGQLGDHAWFKDNLDGEDGQRDIGQKKPSPWGLYDMHGNVWEWTLDEYSADAYKKHAGKTVKVWDAVVWPKKAYPRVARGGSWEFAAKHARSAARLGSHNDEEWKEEDPNLPLSPWWFTSDPARGVGFRLVRQLDWPDKELRKKVWEIDSENLNWDVKDRISEGRGVLGVVGKDLPKAIEDLQKKEDGGK